MKAIKQLHKGISMAVTLLLMSIFLFCTNEAGITASAAEDIPAAATEEVSGDVTVQSNINVVWKYKTENGKIYKRLLDCDTDKWLTDWIYVRDIP